jgi:hypothetical protein
MNQNNYYYICPICGQQDESPFVIDCTIALSTHLQTKHAQQALAKGIETLMKDNICSKLNPNNPYPWKATK